MVEITERIVKKEKKERKEKDWRKKGKERNDSMETKNRK